MRRFEPPVSHTNAEPSRALVDTPLGTMAFEVFLGGAPVAVSESFVGESGLELRRHECSDAEIELLLIPFSPPLPEGMRVDGCVAAVWRAKVGADEAKLAFRAVWAPGARIEDGGSNTGEHLTALTWYAPDAQASLGTSDEEMLSYAAKDGYLPSRLASVFLAKDAYYARFVGVRDGLEIVLPPLLAGEAIQAHFVLAWIEGEIDWDECSPWFAVDVAPREIARMVDEALGSAS